MCGHVGFAGSTDAKSIDAFNDLLYFDTVRGPHATGVLTVRRGNERHTEVFKRIGTAQDLMECKRYDQITGQSRSLHLGHNRFATVGARNNANAHPFEFEHIIGAHNGTIPFQDRSDIIDGIRFDTDSEGIFNMINELGVEATIPQLFGAWALVWYDKRENSINFLRNSERELCWTYANERKQVWWASEPGMLHAALQRRGIDYEKVWWLMENQHNRFIIPENSSDAFAEPDLQMIEGRAKRVETFPVAARYPQRQTQGSEVMQDNLPFVPTGGRRRTTSSSANTGRGKGRKLPEVGGWATPIKIKKGQDKDRIALKCFGNELMMERAFKRRTNEECCGCNSKVTWKDVAEDCEIAVKFVNENEFLCEECEADPWIMKWFGEDEVKRVIQ